MAVYQHFQQLKMAEPLPDVQKVGACITCNWWEVETPRPVEEAVRPVAAAELASPVVRFRSGPLEPLAPVRVSRGRSQSEPPTARA